MCARRTSEQEVHITTLEAFDPEETDMFTVVLIGNSQSYEWNGTMITPRGYYREEAETHPRQLPTNKGQDIMIRSFRTIEKELKNGNIPLDHKWALLHAIHTTADLKWKAAAHRRQSSGNIISSITGSVYGLSSQM